jgi:hypothetical protein
LRSFKPPIGDCAAETVETMAGTIESRDVSVMLKRFMGPLLPEK